MQVRRQRCSDSCVTTPLAARSRTTRIGLSLARPFT
jgi:hypothetical protein